MRSVATMSTDALETLLDEITPPQDDDDRRLAYAIRAELKERSIHGRSLSSNQPA